LVSGAEEVRPEPSGIGTDFGVGDRRGEAQRGVRFLGAASPLTPARGSGECCKLPQRGPGRSPGR